MSILVLGISGMLGNAVFRFLSSESDLKVAGTVRSSFPVKFFDPELRKNILIGVDAENQDSLEDVFAAVRPKIVINCVGLVKQLTRSKDPLVAIPINSILPHRLAKLCRLVGARLIHVSTDCVFAGTRGNYSESDPSDAEDLYGKSKYLGEVAYPHTLTLRTSIIGHELASAHGLVDWFLSQEGSVKGYQGAIFSGLPTAELARIILEKVIPKPELSGLYHVSSAPISKYDLLRKLAKFYKKEIEIVPDSSVMLDRSLNSERFRSITGYVAPDWDDMVKNMYKFNSEKR